MRATSTYLVARVRVYIVPLPRQPEWVRRTSGAQRVARTFFSRIPRDCRIAI